MTKLVNKYIRLFSTQTTAQLFNFYIPNIFNAKLSSNFPIPVNITQEINVRLAAKVAKHSLRQSWLLNQVSSDEERSTKVTGHLFSKHLV